MDLKNEVIHLLETSGIGIYYKDLDWMAEKIVDILLDRMESSVSYYKSEIAMLRSQIEELEIDLMLSKSAFSDTHESFIGYHDATRKNPKKFRKNIFGEFEMEKYNK